MITFIKSKNIYTIHKSTFTYNISINTIATNYSLFDLENSLQYHFNYKYNYTIMLLCALFTFPLEDI